MLDATNAGDHRRRRPPGCALGLALSLAAGCASEDVNIGTTRREAEVGDFLQGTCSLGGVIGLSLQVAEEVSCVAPGTLEPFGKVNGINYGAAVIPYLHPSAVQDLLTATADNAAPLTVNSAYRTVVQQYLLYEWYQQGRCAIAKAAVPGQSNHESGRALDIGNYSTWSGILPSYGWVQNVPGDSVHFEHPSSPDNRGTDVLAFQRLWNRNNPGDLLVEDGAYGPQTRARLQSSPADGFPISGCQVDSYDAELVSVNTPTSVQPSDTAEVTIEMLNTGGTTWTPETTLLGTSMPRDRDSDLYDPDSWVSQNRPTAVSEETEPGEIGSFSFVVRVPEVEEATVWSESYAVVEEWVTWFGPEEIAVELVIGVPGDPDDVPEPDPEDKPDDSTGSSLVGGCSAAGGAESAPTPLLVALLLLGFGLRPLSRRRRGRGPK